MWQDKTSYSRSDVERKPTTWTAQSGRLTVTVTCGHIDYKPDWVMHCHELGINTRPLPNAGSKEEAQAQAIAVVKAKIASLMADANNL